MNPFNKRTAWRIGAVSLLLAFLPSPLAWFVARKKPTIGVRPQSQQ
jgi:hypothetical protein